MLETGQQEEERGRASGINDPTPRVNPLDLSPEEEPIGKPQEQGITGGPETGTINENSELLQAEGGPMPTTPPEGIPEGTTNNATNVYDDLHAELADIGA